MVMVKIPWTWVAAELAMVGSYSRPLGPGKNVVGQTTYDTPGQKVHM